MELGVLEVCETSRVKVNELARQLAREHDRIFETEEDDIAEQKKIVEYTEKIKALREFLQSEKLPGSVVTKIPNVNLRFTGTPKDWKFFKTMYEATVSSHNLSVVEQFLVLVNALPIQLRRILPTEPTRENLSWILKHLTDRYRDDEMRILREISDLKFIRTAFSAYVDRLTGLWIQAKESEMRLEVAGTTIQTQLWENLPRNITISLKSEEVQSVDKFLKILTKRAKVERELAWSTPHKQTQAQSGSISKFRHSLPSLQSLRTFYY
ncbi:UNVERIFIED_CONTAM: hypothetical protein PYX00_003436 [Menopon gallinae]|uniref:Uncharacterized protein n=1 Tax=Menopon gallinae TaxID=328185 RepID=A0AAW2I1L4_9NEOP